VNETPTARPPRPPLVNHASRVNHVKAMKRALKVVVNAHRVHHAKIATRKLLQKIHRCCKPRRLQTLCQTATHRK
jgi:hypothetical protein